ncbi:4a-hydroxytetrahydrobiopterin dehydratase [Aquibacillus halophilus]|uniref:4a-hydroxytetrahydrobiopterin dehydratase n=1 Tax=Aquibacillus halophilus TaxID=930132 RepID=A0A6A8DSV6_9BACI|nr:4a-hydroxytetrahydrobiopterin dehydratase [Aquibacillus halophilus]
MERLNEEKINNKLNNLTDWKLVDEKWIERQYRFKDYLSGVRFVQEIANYAEDIKHHPLISIDYKKVTVKLSSWQEKGLTELDFDMAHQFEWLYEKGEK